MTETQRHLLDRADRALQTARLALDDGDGDATANRAYYACFYLAQAALIGTGETPKTHSGTHSRFAFHFIAAEALPPSTGSILADIFAIRQRSDYNAALVTDLGAAADLLADAKRFVEAVRPLIA